MLEWMIMPLKRYTDFSGRSRRKEFWMFQLLVVLVSLVIGIVATVLIGPQFATALNPQSATLTPPSTGGFAILFILVGIAVLGLIIPSIAVVVRRLHDRDLSGWWYLGAMVAGAIPFVGFLASIALLVLMVLPGTPGPNRFGPDPKDPSNAEVFA